jgi:hypothetical protein
MTRSSVLSRPVQMARQSGTGTRILVRSTRATAPFFNFHNHVVSSGNRIVRLTGPGAGRGAGGSGRGARTTVYLSRY